MDPNAPTTALTRRCFIGCATTAALACGATGTAHAGSRGTAGRATIPPGTVLAKTADVPLTGGIVVQVGDDVAVVAQPAEATFTAFNAVCTHEGCTVNEIVENVIICPCHDSRFSSEDGKVVQGPAEDPLPVIEVEVSGENVVTTGDEPR
ncbi:Rieske (2Fe-2S) protein [Lentzea tibetensis]|uniref:Cytochrome bc1 complex Rieske iron-sulfur subunit n=1 Tax=Lentzea tibetensis TaxID=2591470 RepID=A0A563EJ46_9PSEU|nr:Rieske (2Fe-2S) protein [Lentzea tibetensis]TWP46886.1 Rieske (2Fe-2S) protein [Lentzea tibetensis]